MFDLNSPDLMFTVLAGIDEMSDENMGWCPVCRKSFLAKDIEHVLDLVEAHSEVVWQ